jgi:hypothetical protein
MSGRSVLLWVLIPFLGLCALALWLTRPASPPAAIEAREEQGPALAVPPSSPAVPRPGGNPPEPAAAPSTPPSAPPPATLSPPFRTLGEGSTLPSRSPPPPPASIPEAEPQQESSEPPPVDKEDIRRAIQTVVPLIRQCFEDVAERYPGAQTVKLKFTIEGQGLTGYFKDGEVVDSSIQDPFALACFLDSLVDVRFPAPRGGGRVTITYPFHFQPGGDAGR